MNLKQFWPVLLMSVLIIAVSAILIHIRNEVFAQQTPYGPGGLPVINVPVQAQPPKWLVSFERLEQQNVQQVIIVDPETQRIGVYHVGLEDGTIQLKNIRHINADLQLRVFNVVEPSPQYFEEHYLHRGSNQ